ncbi:MAG TPA: hypothetical protein VM734_31605 [Kofleriaceae bacterium]|nr:hypothetical protein [Kofleriaceae bacterium]
MKRTMFVLAVTLVACGGEDTPVEKCDDLVSTVCDRLVECLPGAATRAQCIQEIQAALPCGSARDVTASYGRCMENLEEFSCPVLFPNDPETGEPSLVLPADCQGVILTGRASDPAEPHATPLPDALLQATALER